MDNRLLGKCGFYCGSCPTFLQDSCKGCMDTHVTGDCFTRDCVLENEITVCGACADFPCETIMIRPRCTVLDKDWMRWKRESKKQTERTNGTYNDGTETLHEVELQLPPVQLRFNCMDEAVNLIREVAAWGRERGYRVWPDEWLTQEVLLSPEVQPENFCVGTVRGEPACAFILQWCDSASWPDAREDEAAYLHKFCVRRRFAGQDMTRRAIEAIRGECRRRGLRYLRLDTALDEKTVRKLYLGAGFHIVDILDYDTGRSLALYQLETGL